MHGHGTGAGAQRARDRLAQSGAPNPRVIDVVSRQQRRWAEGKRLKAQAAAARQEVIRNRRKKAG